MSIVVGIVGNSHALETDDYLDAMRFAHEQSTATNSPVVIRSDDILNEWRIVLTPSPYDIGATRPCL